MIMFLVLSYADQQDNGNGKQRDSFCSTLVFTRDVLICRSGNESKGKKRV